MKKVTFLGLGIMGGPMAAHIQEAGFDVTVYNRSKGKPGEQAALDAGCKRADTIAAAVQDADIVCCCLGDEASVREVLLSDLGAISNMRHGTTVIDFTTIGEKAAVAIAHSSASKGITFIDAPVTGGDVAAKAGTLTIMAGVSPQDLGKIEGVLKAVSSKIVPCGRVGAGQATKLINQLMVAVNLASVCEALHAAERLSIAPETVVEACSSGAAGSWQLANLGLKAAVGDYNPGFKIAHLIKDLRLLSENLSAEAQPEFASEVRERLLILNDEDGGFAENGTQALYEFYKAPRESHRQKREMQARLEWLGTLES